MPLTLLVTLIGIVLAPALSYLAIKLTKSGRINTTEASVLWDESKAMRDAYRDEAVQLRSETVALRAECQALRAEVLALREESKAMRVESMALREEAVAWRVEAVALREKGREVNAPRRTRKS